MKRYLPLFYPATSNTLMKKHGWIDEQAVAQQKQLRLKWKSTFHYPLSPIESEAVAKPTNIMLLVIDSWRYDTFNAKNTPHMWEYAKNGLVFDNHIATGNATRTGIFGLFYGIPGTYWHSALANTKAPAFIERLQELDYELGIFASTKQEKP